MRPMDLALKAGVEMAMGVAASVAAMGEADQARVVEEEAGAVRRRVGFAQRRCCPG